MPAVRDVGQAILLLRAGAYGDYVSEDELQEAELAERALARVRLRFVTAGAGLLPGDMPT